MKKNIYLQISLIVLMAFTALLISYRRVMADEYTYDDNGRVIQVVHDDGSCTEYTYDDNGNILSVKTVSPVKSDNNEQKPAENNEQKPAENNEQKPAENNEQKPAGNSEQKSAENSEQKPAGNSEQKPAENVDPKPLDTSEVNNGDNKNNGIKKNDEKVIELTSEESETQGSGSKGKTDSQGNKATGDFPIEIIFICLIASVSGIIWAVRYKKR